jgi:hypothetical protein
MALHHERPSARKSTPLFCVVYMSQADAALTRSDLNEIASRSMRQNRVEDITGFLVKAGGNFIQYLEGPHTNVVRCCRRIESDGRHTNVSLLACASLSARRFSSWDLGFFRGDTGGTESFEAAFLGWSAEDRMLIDEALRVNTLANRSNGGTNLAFEVTPRLVLVKRYFMRIEFAR